MTQSLVTKRDTRHKFTDVQGQVLRVTKTTKCFIVFESFNHDDDVLFPLLANRAYI